MGYFNDARDWFFEARYGLFVHWGLYAITGRHEQVWQRMNMDRADYLPLIDQFNPKQFDPNRWLDLMQEAGMKYLTFTTKHHDGFCLWDTKQTDFNVINSPYGRDIVGELAEACHRRGVPLCLYYSVVDWHHPNYPNEGRHHELPPQPGAEPDMTKYAEFVREQIRELCTNYGRIHGIWWDMNVPKYQDPSINALIRELQPAAVINNRGFDDGDYSTPERQTPPGRAFEGPTEACQSVGMQSWGYRDDEDYYTTRHLMQAIAKILAMGGNYLLNVGPDAQGRIPEQPTQMLKKISDWMQRVGSAWFDAQPASHLTQNEQILLTQKNASDGECLYVTVHEDPPGSAIWLTPFDREPASATLLNTGETVGFEVGHTPYTMAQPAALRLTDLPMETLAHEPAVIELRF